MIIVWENEGKFYSTSSVNGVRGMYGEKVWCFGEPRTKREKELWKNMQPMIKGEFTHVKPKESK